MENVNKTASPRRIFPAISALLALAALLSGLSARGDDRPLVRIGLQEKPGPVRSFEPLAAHLAKSATFRFEIVPFAGFDELETAFAKRRVDLAYLGALKYVQLRTTKGIVPVMADGAPAKSIIAVPIASPLKRLEQLRGRTLALAYEGSTTGHIVPLLLLARAGLDAASLTRSRQAAGPGNLFWEFVGSHEKAAEVVISGEYTAAAMVENVFEKNRDKLRALGSSQPLPGAVLAGQSDIAPALLEELRALLAAYHPPEGAKSHAFAHGARLVTDSDYDEVRAAVKSVLAPTGR